MLARLVCVTGSRKGRSARSGVTAVRASGSITEATSNVSLASRPTRKRKRSDASATPASPMSGAVSTGSGPGYSEFWTPYVQDLSQKLWLPTATDSRVSAWSSWNGCSSATIRNSWFSTPLTMKKNPTNYVTTYSQSQLSSSLATTEGGPQQIANDA